MFGEPKGDICYDIESFNNLFTVVFIACSTGQMWVYEISERRNDIDRLRKFLLRCIKNKCRWVGFNNEFYDYPVMHYLLKTKNIDALKIKKKSNQVIESMDRFGHSIRDKDQLIPQIDLFKIWHFDNFARSTSLKMIEYNLRMNKIQECDIGFDEDVPLDRIDEVIDYNIHDVHATLAFYNITRGKKADGTFDPKKDKIAFREEMSQKYNKNFLNFNDTKIGKEYLIMKLEAAKPGCCYYWENNKKVICQTPRDKIVFSDLLLDYIAFEDPEFQKFYNEFKKITVKETKGSLKGVSHVHKGFQFDFGTGGIHGSLKEHHVEAADDEIIWDWDVTSYYPNLSIINKFAPEHLGEIFCEIYEELFIQRDTIYTKKTHPTLNLMFKFALNGVYGDSNSVWSPFYDPNMTMSITLNGQLLLCMLAEQLMKHVELLQINTDGMTFKCKRSLMSWVVEVTDWWQKMTGLKLEEARYKKMLIRDVNNYLALKEDAPIIDGEYDNDYVKEKGAYETDREMHKNHSMLVVPKAAKANFLYGTDVAEFIYAHSDPLDFCIRTKISKSDKLMLGETKQQRITRYYVSKSGESLRKIMPAKGVVHAFKRKNKLTDSFYESVIQEIGRHEIVREEEGYIKTSRYGKESWVQPRFFVIIDGQEVEADITGLPYDSRIHNKKGTKHDPERITELHKGHSVRVCNVLSEEKFDDIDYDWYIEQAEKLTKGMLADIEYDEVEE